MTPERPSSGGDAPVLGFDVVVAGAGGAGLAAALAAADRGLSVLLVEARQTFRGGLEHGDEHGDGARGRQRMAGRGRDRRLARALLRRRDAQDGRQGRCHRRALPDARPTGAPRRLACRPRGVPLELITHFRYPATRACTVHAVHAPRRCHPALRRLAAAAERLGIELAPPMRLADVELHAGGAVARVHVTEP